MLALGPLALLATSCGGKADPYATSLAQPSEHVELTGSVVVSGKRHPFTASGDFTNDPDRGTMTMRISGTTVRQVITATDVYVHAGGRWLVFAAAGAPFGTETPAQMFRARRPATFENGLVRHVDVRSPKVTMSVDFSRYGKPVRVVVPRSAVREKGSL